MKAYQIFPGMEKNLNARHSTCHHWIKTWQDLYAYIKYLNLVSIKVATETDEKTMQIRVVHFL